MLNFDITWFFLFATYDLFSLPCRAKHEDQSLVSYVSHKLVIFRIKAVSSLSSGTQQQVAASGVQRGGAGRSF
jgi:hypothetical protein